MGSAWKTVRVFISSTFRDMHAERDHLVKVVIPKLRQWCQQYHLHLVDIDLRWGVTQAEADNGQAIDICLREIDGSRPFFVCLLGERYGYVPDQLPAEDQYQFTGSADVTGKSITHLEIIHAVEQPLPRRLPPESGEVCPHAFFYFRRPECVPPPIDLADRLTAAELAEHQRAFFEPVARPGEVDRRGQLSRLKASIRERFEPQGRVFEYAARFDPAATNPEDDRGLKGRLVDLDDLGRRIEADLQRAIEMQFAAQFGAQRPVDPLIEEQSLHAEFAENRTRVYIPRENLEQRLTSYAAGDESRPLVLSGPPGSGKSAILAHWIQQTASRGTAAPMVVARFVGASPASTSLPGLLRGICQELVLRLDLQEDITVENADGSTATRRQTMEIPTNPIQLQQKWPIVLAAAATGRPIVLVIDALNQLDRSAHPDRLHWLPNRMPAGVHLLVSCLDHGAASVPAPLGKSNDPPDWLAALRRRDVCELRVEPLDEAEQVEIIRQLPSVFCKTLDPALVRQLVHNQATRNPLFLTVALEELRMFGGFNTLGDRIAALPTHAEIDEALDALFGQILDRLDRECRIRDLVPTLFRLLASAKDGLSEQELAELLARLVPADDVARRSGEMEVVLRQVRGYLMRKGPLVDFYHRSFWKAVRAKYLAMPDQRQRCHSELADYFGEKPHFLDGTTDRASPLARQATYRRIPNERKVSELPWQLLEARRWDDLAAALCDLEFVAAKCACGMHHQLVEDFNSALTGLSAETLTPDSQGAVRENAVAQYVEQLLQASHEWNDALDAMIRTATLQAALDETDAFRLKHLGLFLDAGPVGTWRAARVNRVAAWSESQIREDIERQRRSPSPIDRVAAFASFVRNEGYLLRDHAGRPGFVVQHAYNWADSGPVFEAARAIVESPGSPTMFLRPAILRPPWNPHPRRLQTMTGHVGYVTGVAMTPDGRWALSAGADATLRLWDLQSGACLHVLRASTEPEVLVVITPDGRRAASVNGRQQLRIWDLVSAECLHVLSAEGWLLAITADGRRVLTGNLTRPHEGLASVFAVDTRSGERVSLQRCDFDLPAVVRPGEVTVAGSLNRLAQWAANQGVFARISQQWIRAVVLTPDAQRAIVATDSQIDAWDLQTGFTSDPLSASITVMDVSPDARLLLLAMGDTLQLWNLQCGLDTPAFKEQAPSGDELLVTADQRHVVSRNVDSLRVWDVETATAVRVLAGHTRQISAVRMLSDGRRLVSGSQDHSLRLWDWTAGQCLSVMKQPGCEISTVAVAPDGRCAVTGGLDALKWVTTLDSRDRRGLLVMWDLADGRRLFDIAAHEGDVMGVEFTRDGRRIVSVGKEDSRIGLWDAGSGECAGVLERNRYGMPLWTPGGERVLSVDFDGTLRVWELESGDCREIQGPVDGDIYLSECGTRAVFVDKASVLRVHDVAGGQQLAAVPGIAQVFGLGRRGPIAVVTGLRHGPRIVDLESHQPLGEFTDEAFQLRRLCVAPSGGLALAVGRGGLHQLWDLERGECLSTLQLPTDSFELKRAGRFVLVQQNYQRWEILEAVEGVSHQPARASVRF